MSTRTTERIRIYAHYIALAALTACSQPEETEPVVPSIGCGPTVCEAPAGFTGQLCCRSHFDGICGQMVAGSCNDLPPEPHPNCDGATVRYGTTTVQLRSCCTSDNECGIVFLDIRPTCTNLTQARTLWRFIGSGDLVGELPEPQTCDGERLPAAAAGSGG